MDSLETRKIILLGKERAGKSSLANLLLGESVFEVNHSSESTPDECERATRFVNGRRITVIDTPGFFDPRRPEEKLQPGIVLCIKVCAYGSDAILIVLKVENFTKQEKDVIEEMFQHLFGDAFKYAAVVFTHGEQLPRGMTIDKFVSQNEHLSDLVRKCGGRCHVVDSIYWKYNQFQVQQLLSTIDKMVMKNKGYPTSEMPRAVTNQVQNERNRQSAGKEGTSSKANRAANNTNKCKAILLSAIVLALALVVGQVMFSNGNQKTSNLAAPDEQQSSKHAPKQSSNKKLEPGEQMSSNNVYDILADKHILKESFDTKSEPCLETSGNNAYNIFVRRHILKGSFNGNDLKEWKRYLVDSKLCGRTPVQSFIEADEGQVAQICSGAGRRVQGAIGRKGNLCISTSTMDIYDVVSSNVDGNCVVEKVRSSKRKVIVACNKVNNRCLPVHFEPYRNQMPDNIPCV